MITEEQFDSLRIGDKVFHSKTEGHSHLFGVYGYVTDIQPKCEITVRWHLPSALFTIHPEEIHYTRSINGLKCFDPPPFYLCYKHI